MQQTNPYADGAAYIEGRCVPIAEARIPILDWGFSHSDVTFDVVHVWQGRFFRLGDHLERFERSVAGLRMSLPHSREGITEILMECVRLSGLRDAYVEMGCTRGVPAGPTRDPRDLENRFFAFAVPFIWVASEEQRRRGLHLVISSVQRIPPESVDPTFKNFHRGDLTRGLFEAYDRGGDTTVLVDGDGNVTEGPGFNVFMAVDGRVVTPARGVLEGITRKTVVELCRECGIPVELGTVPAEMLRGADEVFLSSTAGGILAVATVDGRTLGMDEAGGGAMGPLTRQLHDLYWSKKEAGWHGTPVNYA